MSLRQYAEDELNRTFPNPDELQQLIHDNILAVMDTFSSGGHSGFSAGYTISLITRLIKFLPLTPLTGEDDEWGEPFDNDNMQQNKRCYSVFRTGFDNATARHAEAVIFSDDHGQTYYTCSESSRLIAFPYNVPDEPEKVHNIPTANEEQNDGSTHTN